ncbi:MAG TPA: hypothetical protein VN876_03730 [Gemmatimonadaceae bacterium]|nr:hypothetical protein [Gemmatimonadaceae bacterium]
MRGGLGRFSESLRPSIEALIELLARVRDPFSITTDNIGFTANDLSTADVPPDLDLLINQWCLGWGRDDAPIVAMGTEEAYPVRAVDLGQWNSCCAVIWATGGRQPIVDALDPRSAKHDPPIPEFEHRREFHIHANDYFLVHKHRGRHTWKLLAEAIAGRGNWLPLLDQNVGTLGNLAYQIEVSAYPAKLTADGRASTGDRHAFLSTMLAKMRSSAKVLLFHGRGNDPEWGGRDALAGIFLGRDRLTYAEWEQVDFHGQPLRYFRHGSRLVVLTRALNGNVRSQLLDGLHALIAPALTGS